MRRRSRLLVAVAALAALTGTTACGEEEPGSGPPVISQELEAPPDAKAVELRADLASLLEEEVFLIAHAVRTGERVGFGSELYRAAEKELEKTTKKLVNKLSPLFDAGLKETFQARLDRLVELVLAYGEAQVEPRSAEIPLREEIHEIRTDLNEILDESSLALSDQDLDDHLELTLNELLLALDRLGREERGELSHASSAARRSRGLAAVLAVAVTEDSPEFEGPRSAVSEPARLYADLRTLLEEEFQLSFAAVQVALAEGFDSPLFRTASLQVDESANLFSDRFGTIPQVGGGGREVRLPDIADVTDAVPDDEFDADVEGGGAESPPVSHHRAVRDLLRRHWQLVELFAREAAGDGVEGLTKPQIEERLRTITTFLADVIADQTAIERATIAEPLEKADKELLEAIEALVRLDPEAYAHLNKALDHVADAADVLTDGVVFIQVKEAAEPVEPGEADVPEDEGR